MKLSTNGLIARLLKLSYGYTNSELPKSICPAFWLTLFAVVLSPFNWAIMLIRAIWSNVGKAPIVFSCIPLTLAYLFSAVLKDMLFGSGELGIEWLQWGLCFLIILVGVGMVLGMIFGLIVGGEKIRDSLEQRENTTLLEEFVAARKSKLCPPIVWGDTNKLNKEENLCPMCENEINELNYCEHCKEVVK